MRGLVFAFVLLTFIFVAPAVAAPAQGEADRAVRKQLDKRKIRYEVDKDGDFKVTYEISPARTQVAYVRSATLEYDKTRIREIFSIGYRADGNAFPAAVANRMLEHSNEAKLGAWTKQGSLGIFTSKIPADASDQELLDAIELTISLADELEKELSGDKDEF